MSYLNRRGRTGAVGLCDRTSSQGAANAAGTRSRLLAGSMAFPDRNLPRKVFAIIAPSLGVFLTQGIGPIASELGGQFEFGNR